MILERAKVRARGRVEYNAAESSEEEALDRELGIFLEYLDALLNQIELLDIKPNILGYTFSENLVTVVKGYVGAGITTSLAFLLKDRF